MHFAKNLKIFLLFEFIFLESFVISNFQILIQTSFWKKWENNIWMIKQLKRMQMCYKVKFQAGIMGSDIWFWHHSATWDGVQQFKIQALNTWEQVQGLGE
jgi:hypothetical protein